MVRRVLPFVVLVWGLGACSVLTDLDGLRRYGEGLDASADAGGDVAFPDATSDGPAVDAGPCSPGSVSGLVGYYRFEEGDGGTVVDCSGKNHNGTLQNANASTWSTGIRGGGLRVASPYGCVDFGPVTDFEMTSAGLTVMAWANTTIYPASTSNAIVGKSTDLTVSGWRLYAGFVQELGAGVARPGDAGALFVGKEPLPANVWNHLAVVFAPGVSETFYIDGANVATKGWTTAIVEDKAASVRIGCRSDNTGFYDGLIDEVRIYARALTPSEVALLSAKP